MMAVHFELHVADMARAQAFYAGLFGWRFQPMPGGEQVEYHRIDGSNLPEGVSGGMMRRMAGVPAAGGPVRGATLTFPVADVDGRYEWAMAHGGAEALPPTDYPGMGRVAYVEDGEGNIVGLYDRDAEETRS